MADNPAWHAELSAELDAEVAAMGGEVIDSVAVAKAEADLLQAQAEAAKANLKPGQQPKPLLNVQQPPGPEKMATVTVISPKPGSMPTTYYRLDDGPNVTVARLLEGLRRQVWSQGRWTDTTINFDTTGRIISERAADALRADSGGVREALDE